MILKIIMVMCISNRSHFINREIKAQRDEMTFPRLNCYLKNRTRVRHLDILDQYSFLSPIVPLTSEGIFELPTVTFI